jgi:Protein of unknown function (DUF2854)
MLRQTSLATLGLSLGCILSVVGIVAYIADYATLNLVGFFYGIPLVLGGLALKTSELAPVPLSQPTPPEVLALREAQATTTQNQVRKDITRYCYGQVAPLDRALSYLELNPSPEDIPQLKTWREIAVDGAYTLVLEFESPQIPLEVWQQKQQQIEKYFGPGIRVSKD